ncbi:MAG: GIY-YIG nuclease family protein [Endomicrobiales bacterium]|nr:GIY-YIG nuclease family protein [Endomicrobiales bacterium]
MIDRKEVIRDYKARIPEKGIFVIRNVTNNKVFLGSTLSIYGKFNRERFTLNLGTHQNAELQKDWKAFGEDKFSFEVLETLKLKDEPGYNYEEDLQILEMIWIEKYRPFEKNCYNTN